MKNSIYIFILLLVFTACQQEELFYPKPRAFHRIELPKAEYVRLTENLPYTFEHSKYVKIVDDTSFMAEPYWKEMLYDNLITSIHISYKPIRKKQDFQEYMNDALKLATKHGNRATAIDEVPSTANNGDGVMFYYIDGDVPTSFQFVVTDTTKNFFRAALYVPTSQKNDSLAPVLEYVKKDMLHLLETFDWQKVEK